MRIYSCCLLYLLRVTVAIPIGSLGELTDIESKVEPIADVRLTQQSETHEIVGHQGSTSDPTGFSSSSNLPPQHLLRETSKPIISSTFSNLINTGRDWLGWLTEATRSRLTTTAKWALARPSSETSNALSSSDASNKLKHTFQLVNKFVTGPGKHIKHVNFKNPLLYEAPGKFLALSKSTSSVLNNVARQWGNSLIGVTDKRLTETFEKDVIQEVPTIQVPSDTIIPPKVPEIEEVLPESDVSQVAKENTDPLHQSEALEKKPESTNEGSKPAKPELSGSDGSYHDGDTHPSVIVKLMDWFSEFWRKVSGKFKTKGMIRREKLRQDDKWQMFRASEELQSAKFLEEYELWNPPLEKSMASHVKALIYDLRRLAQRRLWLTSTYGGFSIDALESITKEVDKLNRSLRTSIKKLISNPEEMTSRLGSEIWKIARTEAHQGGWDDIWAKISEIHGIKMSEVSLASAKRLTGNNLIPHFELVASPEDGPLMKSKRAWERETYKYRLLSALSASTSTLSETIHDLLWSNDARTLRLVKYLPLITGIRRSQYLPNDYRTYRFLRDTEQELVSTASQVIEGYFRTREPSAFERLEVQIWVRLLTAESLTNPKAVEGLNTAMKLRIPGAQRGWKLYTTYSEQGLKGLSAPKVRSSVDSFFRLEDLSGGLTQARPR